MSSPDRHRRRVIGALLLPVLAAACGFTPVYGPNGVGSALMGKVAPDQPATQDEFFFTRHLGELLATPESGAYRLAYRLQIAVLAQGVTPDQVTTRYSLNGTASYALTDPAGTVIARGQVSNFTSYSAVGTTVSTMAGEADARRRLATMLADQVVTRLYASVPDRPRTAMAGPGR